MGDKTSSKTIATTAKVPWDSDAILEFTPDTHERYFKKLVRSTRDMYGEIANAVNYNAENTYPGGKFIFCVDASENDCGASGRGKTLADLLDWIGTSREATVYFRHNKDENTTTYTFSSSLDASTYTNITFAFERGVRLSIASGKTVTFPSASHLSAYPSQIFSGDGTVAWGDGGDIIVDWFPTVAAAFATLVDNCTISFTPYANYETDAACQILVNNVKVRGNKALLVCTDNINIIDINPNAETDGSAQLRWIDIWDLYLDVDGVSVTLNTKSGIRSMDVQHLRIERCKIWNMTYGMQLSIRDRTGIKDNWFFNCITSIRETPFYDSIVPQTSFFLNNTFAISDTFEDAHNCRAYSINAGVDAYIIRGGAIAGDFKYGIYILSGDDNHSSSNIVIEGVSYEQGEKGGAGDEHYLIYVDNQNAKTLTNLSVLRNGLYGQSCPLHLERVDRAVISQNTFNQGAASGPSFELDNDCYRINFLDNDFNPIGYAASDYSTSKYVYERMDGIEKWIHNGVVRGYDKKLKRDNSSETTDGTDETSLFASLVGADDLPVDGGIHVFCSGYLTGANGTKKVRLVVTDTANPVNSESILIIDGAMADETDWEVEARMVSISETVKHFSWRGIESDGTITQGFEGNKTIDSGTDFTIEITGQCSDADDTIYKRMGQMDFY